jgi:hypothetical protein
MTRLALLALMMTGVSQDPADERIEKLIEELKTLPDAPTREEFIGRRAMAELHIDGARAFPKLKHAFLTSDHWAVKASLAALLHGLIHGTDLETGARTTSLLDDENVLVRVVAARLLNNSASDSWKKAAAVLARPAEAALSEKLKPGLFTAALLSDADHVRWVETGLGYIDRGDPLKDPPEMAPRPGIQKTGGGEKSVRSAGSRALKDPFRVALNGVSDALRSQRGHAVIEVILRRIEKDDGRDLGRLGLKLRLAQSILGHMDKSCRNTQTPDLDRCQVLTEIMPRIHRVCEKWLKDSTDPWVLNAAVRLANNLAGSGHAPATELMKNVQSDHPNEEVRSMVEGYLKALENRGVR